MKQIIRDYFTFNRRERNGVFVLLCIILLLTLYLTFSGSFYSQEKIDLSKFEKEVLAFEAQFDTIDSVRNSGSQISGGRDSFRKYPQGPSYAKALREGKPDRHFQYLPKKHYEKRVAVVVELNSADTTALIDLKGIGPAFARRIVKFRDLLGGFLAKEQLLEVYGLDREKYDLLAPQVRVDTSLVKKLNVNTASADELDRHPYIDRKTASKIYWYRMNHGDYSDIRDIVKYNLAEEQLYSKLAGYLTLK